MTRSELPICLCNIILWYCNGKLIYKTWVSAWHKIISNQLLLCPGVTLARILPIRRKTDVNRSINQTLFVQFLRGTVFDTEYSVSNFIFGSFPWGVEFYILSYPFLPFNIPVCVVLETKHPSLFNLLKITSTVQIECLTKCELTIDKL